MIRLPGRTRPVCAQRLERDDQRAARSRGRSTAGRARSGSRRGPRASTSPSRISIAGREAEPVEQLRRGKRAEHAVRVRQQRLRIGRRRPRARACRHADRTRRPPSARPAPGPRSSARRSIARIVAICADLAASSGRTASSSGDASRWISEKARSPPRIDAALRREMPSVSARDTRVDAGDRRDAERDAGDEDVEAGEAAAQLAEREPAARAAGARRS